MPSGYNVKRSTGIYHQGITSKEVQTSQKRDDSRKMTRYKRIISVTGCFLAILFIFFMNFRGSGLLLNDMDTQEVYSDISGVLSEQETSDEPGTASGRSIEDTMKTIETGVLPDSHQLEMQIVYQEPELPTGCESVALTMLLMYEGFELGKTDIADDYLLYSDTGDFADGYVGNPYSYEGAGCFPPVLAETAEIFLDEKESSLRAENVSGKRLEELFHYVANGIPAAVWCTMYMSYDIYLYEDGFEQDGIYYHWYENEHCTVLTGYDLENRTVTIHDPLEGIVERDLDEFEYIYDAIGRFAVIIM